MERALKSTLAMGGFDVAPRHSRLMQKIKSKGNKSTERALRARLVQAGIRGWRMHASDLPGKPDFYFDAESVAVFVDGCFWHGCSTCSHVPRKHNSYWSAKIKRNAQRDAKHTRVLRARGIRVVRFWEHDLLAPSCGCVHRLIEILERVRRKALGAADI